MATRDEPNETQTEISIDVAGFMKAFAEEDDIEDDGRMSSRTGEVSMFCKTCLHPYFGEKKAGTIVLRCERCGQTDTVLEERVGSLNPQEWIGNLMMNRFMQAVKEQEDLSANLAEPDVIDDAYRRLSHGLREYTRQMKKLASSLFTVAQNVNFVTDASVLNFSDGGVRETIYGPEVFEAMNAIKALAEVHRILAVGVSKRQDDVQMKDDAQYQANSNNVNEDNCTVEINGDLPQHNDKKESQENSDLSQENPKNCQTNLSSDDATAGIDVVSPANNSYATSKLKCQIENSKTGLSDTDAEERVFTKIRDCLETIGPTVIRLIEAIINHYDLPEDILESINERLKNNEIGVTTTAESKVSESKDVVEHQRDDNNDDVGMRQANGVMTGVSDAEDQAEEYIEEEEGEEEDDRKIFNVTTRQIKDELDKNLKRKLALRFDLKKADYEFSKCDKSQLQRTESQSMTKEVEMGKITEAAPVKRESEEIFEALPIESNLYKDVSTQDRDECTKQDNIVVQNADATDAQNDTEDGFYVNFYTLSAEFVRELQQRRSDALNERKDRALETVHRKIDELKLEMSKVGKAVTEELKEAYKRKMQKVEVQQKRLDERKQQLKEAERLMHHYAMTGQEEKLRELMAQINMHTSNQS